MKKTVKNPMMLHNHAEGRTLVYKCNEDIQHRKCQQVEADVRNARITIFLRILKVLPTFSFCFRSIVAISTSHFEPIWAFLNALKCCKIMDKVLLQESQYLGPGAAQPRAQAESHWLGM